MGSVAASVWTSRGLSGAVLGRGGDVRTVGEILSQVLARYDVASTTELVGAMVLATAEGLAAGSKAEEEGPRRAMPTPSVDRIVSPPNWRTPRDRKRVANRQELTLFFE